MSMNLREGTRRLALLFGAVGAIVCGVLSYAQLQSTLQTRADHIRFEQLANSPVVEQARKDCFTHIDLSAGIESNDHDVSNGLTRHGKYTIEDAPQPKRDKWAQYEVKPSFDMHAPYCYTPNDNPNASDYTPSESSASGIKTVHFERREIASIDTSEGQTFYPTPAPGAWSYLLIAIFPMLGFFIPWGAVRAIGWVGAGFVQQSK